jgi:hypothetical protein
MQKRVDSLAVNPLEASPQTELKAAEARYGMLSKALSEGSRVANMLDKDRRQEIAQFGETGKQVTRDGFFHYTSFGLYTHRASNSADILPLLDSYRRVQFDLNLLEGLVIAGSSPEVTYESSRIKATVDELTSLLPGIQAQSVRARAEKALASLHGFSQDPELKNDFNVALDSLQHSNSEGPGIALAPSATVNGLP